MSDLPADPTSLPPRRATPGSPAGSAAIGAAHGALAARQFELAPVNHAIVSVRRDRARWPLAFLGALAGAGGAWLLLDRFAPTQFEGRAVLEWTADAAVGSANSFAASDAVLAPPPTTATSDRTNANALQPAVVAELVTAEPVMSRALDRIESVEPSSAETRPQRSLDARKALADRVNAAPTGGDRSVTVRVVAADAYRARGQADAVAQSLAEHLVARVARQRGATTRPIDARLGDVEARIATLRTDLASTGLPSMPNVTAIEPGPSSISARIDVDAPDRADAIAIAAAIEAVDADLADVEARRSKFADALADAELDQSRKQASLVEHVQLLRRALDELDRSIDAQLASPTTAPSTGQGGAPTDQATTLDGEYLDALRTYLAQVAAGRTDSHPDVVRARDRMARVDQLRGGAPARPDTPLGRSRALIDDGARLRASIAASEGHLTSIRATLDALATSRTQLRLRRSTLIRRQAIGKQIETLQQEADRLRASIAAERDAPPPFRVTPLDATPAHRDPVAITTTLAAGVASGAALGLIASALSGVRLPRRKSRLVATLSDERISACFGGAPVVAHVPRAVGPWDQVNPLAAGQTVEALSAVRAHVLQLRERGIAQARVIAVVAPMPAAGTTGIVTGLGTLMARSQRLTACVDCNLLSPNLHEKLGLQLSPGWLDAVAGRSALRPTLQPTSDPHLFGFALGTASDDAGHDLVASQRRQQFVAQLATRFDTVLLDLPPLACGASSLVQLRGTDGALVVLTGQEDPQTLALAAEDLRRAGARVLGLVVNHR
jgi:Mrp family chromosome partitioning ATPase